MEERRLLEVHQYSPSAVLCAGASSSALYLPAYVLAPVLVSEVGRPLLVGHGVLDIVGNPACAVPVLEREYHRLAAD